MYIIKRRSIPGANARKHFGFEKNVNMSIQYSSKFECFINDYYFNIFILRGNLAIISITSSHVTSVSLYKFNNKQFEVVRPVIVFFGFKNFKIEPELILTKHSKCV